MSTANYTWSFASDAEGWLDGSANMTCQWASPGAWQQQAAGADNDIAAEYGYWTGTYEDLGVTSGDDVTAVQLTDAGYRCLVWTDVTSSTIDGMELWKGGAKVGDLWTGATISGGTAWLYTGSQTAISGLSHTSTDTIEIRIYHTADLKNKAGAEWDQRYKDIDISITHSTPSGATQQTGMLLGVGP